MNRTDFVRRCRLYDAKAQFYTLRQLRAMVTAEHPDWTREAVRMEAVRQFEGLCRLDADWYNHQRQFFDHNDLCRNPDCPEAASPEDEAAWMEGSG